VSERFDASRPVDAAGRRLLLAESTTALQEVRQSSPGEGGATPEILSAPDHPSLFKSIDRCPPVACAGAQLLSDGRAVGRNARHERQEPANCCPATI
jgi:hypothetical protein